MEIKLYIPESWTDITFKQYRLLLDSQRRYNLDNPIEQLEYRVDQMSILNPDILIEDLKKLTLTQAKEYFDQINVLYDKEPVKKEMNSFEIDGKKYELIKFKHLSLAGWIDAEKYSDLLMSHKLISIFYINPDEYNDIELDKVSDWLDEQPAPTGFYLVSFFLTTQKILELATSLYLEKTKEEIEKMEKIIKLSNKVRRWFGFRSYTPSPTMTLPKFNKF